MVWFLFLTFSSISSSPNIVCLWVFSFCFWTSSFNTFEGGTSEATWFPILVVSCNRSWSFREANSQNIFVSSANRYMLDLTLSWRLFINRTNRTYPNMFPHWIPLSTSTHIENELLATFCLSIPVYLPLYLIA